MEKQELADGSVLFSEPGGAMRFYDLGNGVALHVTSGMASDAFTRYVTDDGARTLAKYGRCIFFADSYEATRTSAGFREGMGSWLRDQNGKAHAHLLLRSKLIEMAASIANMLARRPVISVYSSIKDWETVGRREVPLFRRRPEVVPIATRQPDL